MAFRLVPIRTADPNYRHSTEAYTCDLALPPLTMQAIAFLVSVGHSIDSWICDGRIFFKPSAFHIPLHVLERHIWRKIQMARTVLSETIEDMSDEGLRAKALAEPALFREPAPAVDGANGALTLSVSEREYGKDQEMIFGERRYVLASDQCSRPAALVSAPNDGRLCIRFQYDTFYHGHDLHRLASLFLQSLSGLPVIKRREKDRVWSTHFAQDGRAVQFAPSHLMIASVDEVAIDRFAGAALSLARHARFEMQQRIHDMPFRGSLSCFEEEDNDARDILLERLAAGETIECRSADDAHGERHDCTISGEEIPDYLVSRLLSSELLQCDDRNDDMTTYRLHPRKQVGHKDLHPRDHAVSFRSFEERCRWRRYDRSDYRECLHHDTYNCERCSASTCPVVTPAYEAESDSIWAIAQIEYDPFFEDQSCDDDVPVVAYHSNTERSWAWRAAGELAEFAIVNEVLSSWINFGAGFLVSNNLAAAHRAVANGWLCIDNTLSVGLVLKPSAKTMAAYEKSIREGKPAEVSAKITASTE